MPATVRFFGVGGMTAQFYSDEVMRELEEFKPQVVVLTIGGNDIRHDTKPKDIAGFIGAIADKLKLAGVKKVFFTEISERGKFIKDPFLTQKSFNKQRRKINSLVAEMGIGTIKLQATYPQHYDSDLVHFNNKGNEKYFYDVRKALFSVKNVC
jgi:lysophospholipase L1-like esterase